MPGNEPQSQGTGYPALFSALAAPFKDRDIKTRPQGGRQLQYITARSVMNRLDTVLGPENWWDKYHPLEHSVICELTIRLPDGSTLTKSDAGGYAGMTDSGDDDKSGFSDAFKRAAVKFGIGRHLYGDGVATFKAAPEPAKAMPGQPPAQAPAHHAVNHDNQTGHGSGAYADPDVVKQFTAWAESFTSDVNTKWLDMLTDEHGEIRKGPAELLRPYQLAGHLIKWGRVAMGLKAPDEIRAGSRDKYAAILWQRNQTGVIEEAREYARKEWRDARADMAKGERKTTKTPDPDTDWTELRAQDEVLDIMTTEAGSRG
jgi:hypothetical protein